MKAWLEKSEQPDNPLGCFLFALIFLGVVGIGGMVALGLAALAV